MNETWANPLRAIGSSLTKEQERQLEEVFNYVERANCSIETNHQFTFHDDDFRFHTCTCKYLEVFYVRT